MAGYCEGILVLYLTDTQWIHTLHVVVIYGSNIMEIRQIWCILFVPRSAI